MTAIGGVNETISATQNLGTKETALGKDDFLMLLVAQLENQDPMNPADATEFTAQLAQFSQLEQLTNMNESLDSFTAMSGEMERMSALGLIGQEVVAQVDQFSYDGNPLSFGYRLEQPAADVKLYVLNQSGSNLATLDAQETAPGQYFINWDGLGDSGSMLPPGDYNLVVRALDEDEKVVESTSLIRGKVSGVDLDANGSQLITSAGSFPMTKVERVDGAVL